MFRTSPREPIPRPLLILALALFLGGGCGPRSLTITVDVKGKGAATLTQSDLDLLCGVDAQGTVFNDCTLRGFLRGEVSVRTEATPGWQLRSGFDCRDLSGMPSASNGPDSFFLEENDVNCTFTFVPEPNNFDLDVAPSAISVTGAASKTATVNIHRGDDFVGQPVTLSLVAPPPGLTFTPDVNPVTGDSTWVTLAVTGLPPGQHELTILGEATSIHGVALHRTVTMSVTVEAFEVTLSPVRLTIAQGETGILWLSLVRSPSFVGVPLALSLVGAPTGVSLDSSNPPSPTTADSATLTLRVSQTTSTPGPHQLAIHVEGATGAGPVARREANFSLTISGFSLSVSPESLTIFRGSVPDSVTVTVARASGFGGPVALEALGLPAGVNASFSSNPVQGDTSVLTLTAAASVPLGRYQIPIRGVSGGSEQTTFLFLTVTAGVIDCAEFPPLADTSVASNSGANTSFGTGSVMQIAGIDDAVLSAFKAYLVFDISTLPTHFGKVELALTDASPTVHSGTTRSVSVYGIIDDDDWKPATLAEAAITWNNAPKNDTVSAVGFLGQGTSSSSRVRFLGAFEVHPADFGSTYLVDVSAYVRWALGDDAAFSDLAARDADGKITFALADSQVWTPSQNIELLFSKEFSTSACKKPHLEVR